jgi:hypothetical protein
MVFPLVRLIPDHFSNLWNESGIGSFEVVTPSRFPTACPSRQWNRSPSAPRFGPRTWLTPEGVAKSEGQL